LLDRLSPTELRRILPTAVPDVLLAGLLQELMTTDRRLVILTNSLGATHPEVKATQESKELLEAQVDERIDGMLSGLRLRANASTLNEKNLATEIQQTRKRQIENAINRQPYFQRKRELENLQVIVDHLRSRIWSEKVDAAMSQRKPE
jgi:uncharacterized protein involved in exopolysaccharide biosynthesis